MKKIALICAIIILNACSFRSPQSQFYVMNSTGLDSLSEKKMSVAVARVKVPDMLDKSQMVVYDKDSSEVQILEFHRWAEVLPDMIQATVTNDLIAYLPNAYVQRTYFDSDTVQYSVNIEINRIEAYKGGDVILSAWWYISNSKGRVVKREQRTYTAPTQNSSMSALVDAQAAAIHWMTRDISENLLKM